jgi:hypothetical protein
MTTNCRPHPGDFVSVLTEASGTVLDNKFWRHKADAIKYVISQAQNYIGPIRADVCDSSGAVLWTRSFQEDSSANRNVNVSILKVEEARRARREEKYDLKLLNEYSSGKV